MFSSTFFSSKNFIFSIVLRGLPAQSRISWPIFLVVMYQMSQFKSSSFCCGLLLCVGVRQGRFCNIEYEDNRLSSE